MRPFFRPLMLLSALLLLGGCMATLSDHIENARTWLLGPRPAKASFQESNLPIHEKWCYRTLGKIDCYPDPQDFPPESLVSVDPPSSYPLTREAHAKALSESQKPAEVQESVQQVQKAEPPKPAESVKRP